ncbi:MAG: EthD domain-containing protein [Chitinophagales bacterium]
MEDKNSTALYTWTILYPYKEGALFDFEIYAKTLITEYVEILGDNCVKFEVRKGLATPGAKAPNFICITTIWVQSKDKFMASMADPEMKVLIGKLMSFTEIQSLRQFDQVIT